MKREYYKNHSEALGKDMSMIVYGEGGYPVIAFQSQDSKCNSFEDFGMVDEIADYIEQGRIQLFSVDNNDEESWSARDADPAWRTQRQEDYFRFVTDELVPKVHEWNGSELRPLAIGCSMGGTHAAIAATRRPDLFQGNISLSGVYRSSYFFGDYMDERLYANDVVASLANMPADHPYVDIFNHRTLIFCVGQGAWEEGVDDLRSIDRSLDRLGVGHWCDFWGHDVNHDWDWWKKQIRYFLPIALDDIDRELAEEGGAAKGAKDAAAPKQEPAKKAEPKTKPAAAKKPAAVKAAPAKAKPAARKAEPAAKAAAKGSSAKAAASKPASAAKKAEPARAAKAATPAKKEPAKGAAKPAAKKEAAPKKAATAAKPAVSAKPASTKASATTKPATAKTATAAKASAKPAAAKSKPKPASARAAKKSATSRKRK